MYPSLARGKRTRRAVPDWFTPLASRRPSLLGLMDQALPSFPHSLPRLSLCLNCPLLPQEGRRVRAPRSNASGPAALVFFSPLAPLLIPESLAGGRGLPGWLPHRHAGPPFWSLFAVRLRTTFWQTTRNCAPSRHVARTSRCAYFSVYTPTPSLSLTTFTDSPPCH